MTGRTGSGLREAYAAYARSADGAGSVQPPVVQRLVEAVYGAIAHEYAHPVPAFDDEPWRCVDCGIDLEPGTPPICEECVDS